MVIPNRVRMDLKKTFLLKHYVVDLYPPDGSLVAVYIPDARKIMHACKLKKYASRLLVILFAKNLNLNNSTRVTKMR